MNKISVVLHVVCFALYCQ